MSNTERAAKKAERITLHSLNFDDHADVYDYCMANCKPGDFLELSNQDVVYLQDAWPVLLRSENPPQEEILHRFEADSADWQSQLIAIYEQAKAEHNFEQGNGEADFPKP